MIGELLDLSKMEAGMMDFQFSRASVSQVINQGIEDIRLLAEKKDIQVRSSVNNYLPLILMDVDKIQQVMNNLLSNAVKFTPEKGLVEVSRIDANLGSAGKPPRAACDRRGSRPAGRRSRAWMHGTRLSPHGVGPAGHRKFVRSHVQFS